MLSYSSSSFGRDRHPRRKQQQDSNVVESSTVSKSDAGSDGILSQHRVSTSKTVSPRIPVSARFTGHVRIMCSEVCSAAPQSQFDVGARPHLCMND